MGTTLTGKSINDTYDGLLKTTDNQPLTSQLKEITDGLGNDSGVHMDQNGNLKAEGILEFGQLKDTSENILIDKFVDEADGIAGNDDDRSIPTSAAVKDYVDTKVTAEDLDFSGDTGTGSVDLDSEVLDITGSGIASTTASGQGLDINVPATNLSNTPAATTLEIESTTGTNTTLPAATTSLSGVMTGADKTKLNSVETNADVTDVTNVTTAINSISVTAHSDVSGAGSGVIISTTERNKLTGIEAGAEVNTVDSVNGETGTVVLDTDDVSEGASNLYYTEARVSANSSVTANTAKNSYPTADATKVGHITVTQAVDLDTMESDIANKVSRTGDTGMTGNYATTGHITASNGLKLNTSQQLFNYFNDLTIYSYGGSDINLGGGIGSVQNDVLVGNGYIYTSQGLRVGGNTTANLLDDYEEGTYNIQFILFKQNNSDQEIIGSSGFTNFINRSKYTKIGNRVTINIDLEYRNGSSSNWTSSAYYVGLTNLPFTPEDFGTGIAYTVGGTFYMDSFYQSFNTGNMFMSIVGGYSNYGKYIALGGKLSSAYPGYSQIPMTASEMPQYRNCLLYTSDAADE